MAAILVTVHADTVVVGVDVVFRLVVATAWRSEIASVSSQSKHPPGQRKDALTSSAIAA